MDGDRSTDPALWWPWALGDQPMHDAVGRGVGATTSRAIDRAVRTGLRRVDLRPTGSARSTANASSSRVRTTARRAWRSPRPLPRSSPATSSWPRTPGLDLLRIHAHITRPELYDAADEAGLLLWQDLPLQWGYARGIRKQAVRQARPRCTCSATTRRSRSGAATTSRWRSTSIPADRSTPLPAVRHCARQKLPTWNKTILDRSVKRALEQADGTRPVIAHSGVLPHPPQLDGTDSHLYFGWYRGDERDFPTLSRRPMPRMARFVTEFGAQAVPADATFCEPERWPDLDWERLGPQARAAEADVRSVTCRRPTTPPSTSGATRRSATRRRS